jgi:steroid 5-alpha reductase family enzyme
MAYFSVEIALVLSQWLSDGQQWAYQTAKRQYQKDAKLPKGFKQEDLDRGFITSGMWAYSRHPNFFAEQMIWFVLYQWSCYSTNVLFNWTFAGCASLILLFQGSTWLTELITAGKYPEYTQYQKKVGMFIPVSLKPYKTPMGQPKIIRTSELAKRESKKQN